MRARIGIADTSREIEVEVAGREELMELLEGSYRDGAPIIWFKTANGADIAVPVGRLAFIELIDSPSQSVGFGR